MEKTLRVVSLFNGVLVKLLPMDKVVRSGIEIIPVGHGPGATDITRGQKSLVKATVVKVGPGVFQSKGVRVPPTVQVGDVVYFEEQQGRPLVLDGDEYWILQEVTILVVAHDKDGNSIEARLEKDASK